MILQLERPLVFFDLETTGVNISLDRIVEISMIKLLPDGSRSSCTYRLRPTMVDSNGGLLFDEQGLEITMHIPDEASAVHHIMDADVVHSKTFKELGQTVLDYICNCDLAGYNSNHFDIPMLQEEFLRVGIEYDIKQASRFIDAFVIFQKHTPRNLTAAYMYYCGKDLTDAHSANADTEATYEVLMAQLEQHNDVPHQINELANYTCQQQMADLAGRLLLNEKGEVVFNFGKYRGKTLESVFTTDTGYYSWLMAGDFPLYTKRLCKQVMDKIKQDRRQDKRRRDATPATTEQLQALVNKYGKGTQLTIFN